MSVVDRTAAPVSCKMDIRGYGSRLALRLAGTTWILYPRPVQIFKQPKQFQKHLRIPAARCARGFAKTVRPKKTEGAGNAGRPMHPQPRMQNKNSTRA